MKREKISLFILVAEIAVISLLHSAKSNDKVGQPPVNDKTATVTFQLTPNLQLTKIK